MSLQKNIFSNNVNYYLDNKTCACAERNVSRVDPIRAPFLHDIKPVLLGWVDTAFAPNSF